MHNFARRACDSRVSAPHLARGVDDEAQLGDLLGRGQRVALERRGEAALRAEAELLERDIFRGLLDAALERVLLLQRAVLGGDQAEHDHLALGHEAQRLEPARARIVVFEEEAVDLELAEQRLGDVVVAARSDPGGAEIAAAHMRAHGHAGGLLGERGVDEADIGQVLALARAAEPGDVVALRRVVEICQAGVVELEIAATELAQRRDLVGIDAAEIVPERGEVGIDLVVDGGAAAAVMHHARRGHGELRRCLGDRFQEGERLGEDRPLERELAGDAQRRRGELDVALLVVELDREIVLHLGDAADLVEEIHVPGGAAVLAVGDALEADLLLHLHRLGHGVVLDPAHRRARKAARLVLLARLQQFLGPQQAADMVGAEGRRGARRHGHAAFLRRASWTWRLASAVRSTGTATPRRSPPRPSPPMMWSCSVAPPATRSRIIDAEKAEPRVVSILRVRSSASWVGGWPSADATRSHSPSASSISHSPDGAARISPTLARVSGVPVANEASVTNLSHIAWMMLSLRLALILVLA